jgi:hypothetical protein
LFDSAGGQQDLTERRLASGFDENQTFVAIFYSCVLKMQHSDGWIGTPSMLSLGCVQLSLSRDRCAVAADRPDHLSKKPELQSFRADLC